VLGDGIIHVTKTPFDAVQYPRRSTTAIVVF